MSNKKINFKTLSDSDKVKLINNSLVLEGLTLKELSKKINVQKKDIILFMKSEGFTFDEIDGYFKKEILIKSVKEESNITSLDEIKDKKSPSELEDVQSIIDSINQKLNIKEGEPKGSLLPEIKAQSKIYSLDDSIDTLSSTKSEEKNEILTLEIPKVSRTERRKKLKKSPIKRFLEFFKSLFKRKKEENLILPSNNKEELLLDKPLETPFEATLIKDKIENDVILDEVATSSAEENKLPDANLTQDEPTVILDLENKELIEENIEKMLESKVKLPIEFKVLSKKYDKNKIIEKTIIDLDKLSIDYLKEEIATLKIDPAFIENLKSSKINDSSSEDLEMRVKNLEKKVAELEDFFIEMFQGMLIK